MQNSKKKRTLANLFASVLQAVKNNFQFYYALQHEGFFDSL